MIDRRHGGLRAGRRNRAVSNTVQAGEEHIGEAFEDAIDELGISAHSGDIAVVPVEPYTQTTRSVFELTQIREIPNLTMGFFVDSRFLLGHRKRFYQRWFISLQGTFEIIPLTGSAVNRVSDLIKNYNEELLEELDLEAPAYHSLQWMEQGSIDEKNLEVAVSTEDSLEFVRLLQGDQCFCVSWSSWLPLETAAGRLFEWLAENAKKTVSVFLMNKEGNLIQKHENRIITQEEFPIDSSKFLRINTSDFDFTLTAQLANYNNTRLFSSRISLITDKWNYWTWREPISRTSSPTISSIDMAIFGPLEPKARMMAKVAEGDSWNEAHR